MAQSTNPHCDWDTLYEYFQDLDHIDIASLSYLSETKSETLNPGIRNESQNACDMINSFDTQFKPTHVVTAITYGGNAVIVFQKTIDTDTSNKIISGGLSAKYTEEPDIFTIQGSFKLNDSKLQHNLADTSNIKVKFY